MDTKIDAPYGAIENGALGVKDGLIAWVGKVDNLPDYEANDIVEIDPDEEWITPGLVDCHTHLVFGGNRAREFERRLKGESYADIAKSGGGILSTVAATREEKKSKLYHSSSARLLAMVSSGITTIEIKSGYGLNLKTEKKMLKAAAKIGRKDDVRVLKTFLGAHALPPEFKNNPDGYIDLVCTEMIPEIARLGLADAVDGFCENIAFSPAQIRRVFEAAQKHELPVKLHAEQLSYQGGAKLAAEFGALSADHLEYIDEDGVRAMAQAGTVAVLLPGAFYTLKETQKPPIDLFRKYEVPMALASDCNPGSSPIMSPLMTLNMACTLFGMAPEEALAGMTREGAKALGIGAHIGTLEIGKSADLVVWSILHPSELSYWIGNNFACDRYLRGRSV